MKWLAGAAFCLLAVAPLPALQKSEALLRAVDSEKGINISMRVETLEGDVLLDFDGDSPRILASNTKLLTTAAAVTALDPDSRWETRCIYVDGALWIIGDGDPSMRQTATGDGAQRFLDALVGALEEAGIASVEQLVLDARAFGDEYRPPGWPSNQQDKSYCAPTGALQVEGSRLSIDVVGGRVRVRPAVGDALTVQRSDTNKNVLSAWWKTRDQKLAVRGGREGVGPAVVSVNDPVWLYGAWLSHGLRSRGITVGATRQPDMDELPPAAEPLLLHASLWTMAEALAVVNKDSDNQLAETVLQTLGHRLRVDGSRETSLEVVRQLLEGLELDLTEVEQADGSGMSRGAAAGLANSASPAFLCALLRKVAEQKSGRVLFLSLPVAGEDGRVKDRFRDPIFQPGRVRAKTGFISGASSLSGYIQAQDETVLVFSFVANYTPDGKARTNNARFKKLRQDVLKSVLEERPWR